MTGPFYVKEKDLEGNQNFILAECCKECVFCDEEASFCCINPCTYFYDVSFDNDGEENDERN